ncbi:hypothetical protein J14TS2_33960 [Bacillus sp. J14TS2]|uniref:DUF418 domain-containing protein n=1 Tax=Bacillus sp. J14TS2 TaxID=2807188 RepID=UPI001B07943F|nr:DUF418 domain-containing protein [Bacillus sp. J14TS2]GIN72921.1 hypothetical protein J14TS2_33960 [Bacillus sp. J14TS2]
MYKQQQNKHSSKKRAISLDLARGFMLLLIILAHVPLLLYGSEPGLMSRTASVTSLDRLFNVFGELFIDNRARPLFAVLFGYGLVMIFESQLSKGYSQKEARKTVRRRSLYLILFGVILAVLIGGQDILMAYGTIGLLVGWLLLRSNKVLITVTIIITSIFISYIPILWGFILYENGSYGFGTEFSADYHYIQSLVEALLYFPIIPLFIHFLFPILPSVLVGMWLGRKKLLTAPQQNSRLKMIAIICITISLLGALPLALIGETWMPSLFSTGVLNGIQIITGTAGGIGYAALFGILGNLIKSPGWLTNALTALGKRSLTFFVLNETLLVILFSPVAFGLGGKLTNTEATFIAIFIWCLGVFIAYMLEKFKINGPLESLMRHAVYKK